MNGVVKGTYEPNGGTNGGQRRVIKFRPLPRPNFNQVGPEVDYLQRDDSSEIIQKLKDQILDLTKRVEAVEKVNTDKTYVNGKSQPSPDEDNDKEKLPDSVLGVGRIPPSEISSKSPGSGFTFFFSGLYSILSESWINVLLLAVPFALAGSCWQPAVTFILCIIAIIPLAKLLGSATEELALHTSQARPRSNPHARVHSCMHRCVHNITTRRLLGACSTPPLATRSSSSSASSRSKKACSPSCRCRPTQLRIASRQLNITIISRCSMK